MITSLKTFVAVLVPMLILDGLWLAVIAKSFYAKHLGAIMTPNPVWVAAILFYLLYAVGITYFIVAPAVAGSLSWYAVLLRGALFGLVAYATYDLTNHATVVNWPTIITVVDMAWGATITGVTGLVAWAILR
jgi:uncharacterized membrane protein